LAARKMFLYAFKACFHDQKFPDNGLFKDFYDEFKELVIDFKEVSKNFAF
jgi:hypothetical protein